MSHKPLLKLSTERRLVMTFQMQQALAVLQMSQMELSQFIQQEIDTNPIIEELPSKKKSFLNPEIPSSESLHENLMQQIRENFLNAQDRTIAKQLLEHLDEKGFLSMSEEEIGKQLKHSISDIKRVVSILQTFTPPGIFARNLQESFLIQLKACGNENSPIFHLVKDHFQDLLHGRFSAIQKKEKEIDLAEAIHKLSLLQLRPLDSFRKEISAPLVPDLILRRTEKGWAIAVSEEELPKFQIVTTYEKIPLSSEEEQETLQMWASRGKWLLHCLSRRRKILLQIGALLVRRQTKFLSQEGSLKPLTSQELALKLQLHESTISRALCEKTIETPRGIFPLKALLSSSPEKNDIQTILQELVSQENKTSPLTDEELSMELQKRGYEAARRTISKYRRQLKISSAKARKFFR